MQERYFIAISLPDDIAKIITDAQKELLDGYLIMQPFQPHITLLPPNILDKIPPDSIVPQIKLAAEPYLPIDITLDEFGLFEKRVLYINAISPALVELQSKLMHVLPYEAIARSDRKFVPHLTLAQAKPKQDLPSELIDKLKDRISSALPLRFEAKNISKFKWLKPRTYQDTEI